MADLKGHRWLLLETRSGLAAMLWQADFFHNAVWV
jgi:hypothetical protein